MRLKLVPDQTNWDFFKYRTVTFGVSVVMMIASVALWLTVGLNFGIDFRGGTTLRTQSEQAVDVGAYRTAIDPLGLGDVSISEVFDPSFDANQHVAMIRIQSQEGEESLPADTIAAVEAALKTQVEQRTEAQTALLQKSNPWVPRCRANWCRPRCWPWPRPLRRS